MTRLSHSAINKYIECPRKYKYHYIEKLREEQIGSPLFFGSAIDEALNCLLLRKKNENDLTSDERELVEKNPIDVFNENFCTIEYNNENIVLGCSLKTRYSTADFDEDILEQEDLDNMTEYLVDQGYKNHDGIAVMHQIKAFIKQNGFRELDEQDKIFYNYCNWLSLRRKGHMMIRAYNDQIMPKIKKVISIQREVELPNEEGDIITGFIDFEAIFEDNEDIFIADNKTSSKPYKEDSVKDSQQLTIYCESQERENAAYCVLNKKVRKVQHKTCQTCNTTTTGREKTCKVGGTGKNRCGGEFDIVFECSIDTQIIKDKITEEQKDLTFDTIQDILWSIREEDFHKIAKKDCFQFGKRCVYYGRCWEDSTSMEGLVKKEE